jgi:hypothetical protein
MISKSECLFTGTNIYQHILHRGRPSNNARSVGVRQLVKLLLTFPHKSCYSTIWRFRCTNSSKSFWCNITPASTSTYFMNAQAPMGWASNSVHGLKSRYKEKQIEWLLVSHPCKLYHCYSINIAAFFLAWNDQKHWLCISQESQSTAVANTMHSCHC